MTRQVDLTDEEIYALLRILPKVSGRLEMIATGLYLKLGKLPVDKKAVKRQLQEQAKRDDEKMREGWALTAFADAVLDLVDKATGLKLGDRTTFPPTSVYGEFTKHRQSRLAWQSENKHWIYLAIEASGKYPVDYAILQKNGFFSYTTLHEGRFLDEKDIANHAEVLRKIFLDERTS